jgi:hypothetical protein
MYVRITVPHNLSTNTHTHILWKGRGEGGERGDMPICVWAGFASIRYSTNHSKYFTGNSVIP